MFACKARDPADPRVIVGDGPFAANWDGKAWSRGMGIKSVDEIVDDFVALSEKEASDCLSVARKALSTETGKVRQAPAEDPGARKIQSEEAGGMFGSKARDPSDPRVIVGETVDGVPFIANWDGRKWSEGNGVASVDEIADEFNRLSASEASEWLSAARRALSNEFGQGHQGAPETASAAVLPDKGVGENAKWAATFAVWLTGAGVLGWLWDTRVFVSDIAEQIFEAVLYLVACLYAFALRPIYDWLEQQVFHSHTGAAEQAARAVKVTKLAAATKVAASVGSAATHPLKSERKLEFASWDNEPLVFWSTDKRRWAWLIRAGSTAWVDASPDEFIDASKEARLLSEEGFVKIFGKLPPLPQ